MTALLLPPDEKEFLSIPFDGASLDGLTPTPGLPLESARTPDPDVEGATVEQFPHALGMSEMRISQRGLSLIENFEGYSGVAYYDSVGVRTIGYGTTAAVVDPVPDTCTRAQAQAWLVDSLARDYEPAIRATGCPLNQNQFDALCSFVYNLGPGSMSAAWRIGAALRAHDYVGVAAVWDSYDTAGGVVLVGLLHRRKAERALFLTPMPKPAPPNPFLIYDDEVFDINGVKLNERLTVEHFVGLYPKRSEKAVLTELEVAHDHLVMLRKRVWAVAHESHPANWQDRRGERWQGLKHLTDERL